MYLDLKYIIVGQYYLLLEKKFFWQAYYHLRTLIFINLRGLGPLLCFDHKNLSLLFFSDYIKLKNIGESQMCSKDPPKCLKHKDEYKMILAQISLKICAIVLLVTAVI